MDHDVHGRVVSTPMELDLGIAGPFRDRHALADRRDLCVVEA